MWWVISGIAVIGTLVICVCIRGGSPRTKKEEQEAFKRDCAEFDAYVERKKNEGK